MNFVHQLQLMVFYKSLSDSNFHQVSRRLLTILAYFSCAVVSILPLISSFPGHFSMIWLTVPKALTAIVNVVTFMFRSFFFVLLQDPGICLCFQMILFSAFNKTQLRNRGKVSSFPCPRKVVLESQRIIIFTQPLRSGRIWHKVNSEFSFS